MHDAISYYLAQGNGGYAYVPGGRVLAKWTGRQQPTTRPCDRR